MIPPSLVVLKLFISQIGNQIVSSLIVGAGFASDEPARGRRSDRGCRPRVVHPSRRRHRAGTHRLIARLERQEDAQSVRRVEVRPRAPAASVASTGPPRATFRDVRAGARARHGRPPRANPGAERVRQRRGRLARPTAVIRIRSRSTSSTEKGSGPVSAVVAHRGRPGAVLRSHPRRADDPPDPRDPRRGPSALRQRTSPGKGRRHKFTRSKAGC